MPVHIGSRHKDGKTEILEPGGEHVAWASKPEGYVNLRNAIHFSHGEWKPTGKKARKHGGADAFARKASRE